MSHTLGGLKAGAQHDGQAPVVWCAYARSLVAAVLQHFGAPKQDVVLVSLDVQPRCWVDLSYASHDEDTANWNGSGSKGSAGQTLTCERQGMEDSNWSNGCWKEV